jgi:hypothetical protein
MTHMPTILPPPRDRVTELQRENDSLKTQIRELNIALTREQEQRMTIESGALSLRSALSPLYRALQHVFGDLDAMGIQGTQAAAAPQHKAVWENWKQKLGGLPARAIDALLLHGAMNRTQLRIQLGCANGSVTNVIVALNKAGLIDKNGSKVSLKEL